MSIEIGSHSKSIQYLSIHKEATNDSFVSTDDRWSTPILQKQDDYLVALSRFEVPMNLVPITNKMENCIQIFRYNDRVAGGGNQPEEHLHFVNNVEHLGMSDANIQVDLLNPGAHRISRAEGIAFLDACEVLPTQGGFSYNLTTGANTPQNKSYQIDMDPCYTVYEFLKKINAQIQEALIMNSGYSSFQPRFNKNYANRKQNDGYKDVSSSLPNSNLYTKADGTVISKTDPIARFEIFCDDDSTFSVKINHAFARWYYVKFSQELFDMLQFKEIHGQYFDRAHLPGRRFMADRHLFNATQQNQLRYQANGQANAGFFGILKLSDLQTQTPGYTFNQRLITCYSHQAGPKANGESGIDLTANVALEPTQSVVAEFTTSFVAPCSAADSIVRVKSLVFTSSLATTSESVSGNTFRRILTDFTIPTSNGFGWKQNTNGFGISGSGIQENPSSRLIYANANPSAGRWLSISDPSSLYELKMEVYAKCWNFATRQFDYELIKMPSGSTLNIKLVFISRNELYHQTRPDKIHKP